MLTRGQRWAKLLRYRAEQVAIAWERDEELCQRCGRYGSPPHHVWGKAATWDVTDRKRHEDRERADKIVVLCLTCHGRCHNDLPKIGRDEVIQVLELALED